MPATILSSRQRLKDGWHWVTPAISCPKYFLIFPAVSAYVFAHPDVLPPISRPITCQDVPAITDEACLNGLLREASISSMHSLPPCTVTCRFQEHLKAMPKELVSKMPDVIDNIKFKCEFMDVPFKKNENGIDHYEKQLKAHVLDFLHDNYGVDTSDEALRKTIEEHNEVCKLIRAIGDFRKLDHPTITGYEFAVINLVTMCCPKYLIVDKLRETLTELMTREPDPVPSYRCKVVLCGSENDDPEFTKLIESCGALVVADRYCYGAVEAREPIEILPGETPLRAIARHYLLTSNCTRFMEQGEMRRRKQFIADLAREYKADGIIIATNKFCEYWSYERVVDTVVLQRDFGYPVCSIEKEYINTASGQLRTRFQAFVESVEIKKIQARGGEA